MTLEKFRVQRVDAGWLVTVPPWVYRRAFGSLTAMPPPDELWLVRRTFPEAMAAVIHLVRAFPPPSH